MANIVIVGASRGLGFGLAEGLPAPGDVVWMLSRSRPPSVFANDAIARHQILMDVRDTAGWSRVKEAIRDEAVDCLIYCAAIWESHSDILAIDTGEAFDICAVNVAGFLVAVSVLSENLRLARRAWIVAIGSTAGLENSTGPRAAYAASKFALRGAVHALRERLRPDGIGVTCLSVGALASDIPFSAGLEAALAEHHRRRIPTADVIIVLRALMALSPATCIKDISMPAQFDEGV